MKNISLILYLPGILSLLIISCRQKITDPIHELNIKTGINDTRGLGYNNRIKEIIPLKDNTFWVHYRVLDFPPYRDKFEHYDENFKLLDSVYFEQALFGKFIVNGNNDIVVSVTKYFPQGPYIFYRFWKLDNKLNILKSFD